MYAFNGIGVSGCIFFWLLSTFGSCRVRILAKVTLFTHYSSMFRFPIYNFLFCLCRKQENIAQDLRKYLTIVVLLNFFIGTAIDRFIALNVIWFGFSFSRILWGFIILKKRSSFGVIWFENLRICISFTFVLIFVV